MGKTKSAKPEQAIKSSKDAQTPKAKSKEMAKQVASKAADVGKKSKKPVKAESPSDSDMSDASSESDAESSASSASSDDESDEGVAPKVNGTKTNGIAKAATNGASESESESDSSESSESSDEEDAKPAVAPQVTAGKKAPAGDEDSEEDSEDESSEEESEDEKPKGAVNAKALNGKLEKDAPKKPSSASDSDDSGSDASSASDSGAEDDSDESESESGKEVPQPKKTEQKKRKVEEVTTPVAKKIKTESSAEDEAKKNLFVGQLSWSVDEEWLTREFEPYGELESVNVIYDKQSGRSKGFGYVKFVDAAAGEKAKNEKHRTELDGRTINVDFNQPKDNSTPRQERAQRYGDEQKSEESSTLFVANLSFDATSDVVGDEFGKHGEVIGVRLPTDRESGQPKGFGYVELSSIEEAKKVFGAMSGATIMGRPIRLDYSAPRPPRDNNSPGGFRGGRGGGRGGDRGGRGGGRGRGGFDRGGRGGGRGGRGGSTNRGGFGDFQGKKMSFS